MSDRPGAAVAVLAHTTSQRRLGRALLEAARAAGMPLDLRTMTELASEATVRQEPGAGAVVEPDRTMLWLAVGDRAADDPDERFAQAESYAAARSVALLTRSPVLNRPTPVGSQGALPMSAVGALRGLPPHLRDRARTERFSSDPPAAGGADEEVLDYGTGRRSHGHDEGQGPFRSRRAHGPTAWVTVAGASTLGPQVAGLHELSREVAASYGLGLAHVWWSCPPGADGTGAGAGAGARLARVDAWAWDTALGSRVDDVARALVDWCADPARVAR